MDLLEVETREGVQRVPLAKQRITIGRLPGNDIVLPYTSISRHHAEIRLHGDDWWITDLSSTNGLHINGNSVHEHILRDGDGITLAPGIVLHFMSQNHKRARRVVEGSTVELPAVKAQRREPITPSPAASSAADEAPDTQVDALAAVADIAMPRRRMVVPPSAAAPPPEPSPLLATAPATPEEDLWLTDGRAATPSPSVTNPTPAVDTRDVPFNSPYAIMRQSATTTATVAKKPILIQCHTCGASTAPDSPYCWQCHGTIARPCPQCGLFLLPIQARCPRCDALNPHGIRR
jgi:hypothetical protein